MEAEIIALQLPLVVQHALLAMGSSIAVACVDGPSPAGKIAGVLIAAGTITILAANWDVVGPQWDKITWAFQKAFDAAAASIASAFKDIEVKASKKSADEKAKKGKSKTELPENTTDAGKKGSKTWNDAKKKIKEGKGKGINTRTTSQEEAEKLINEARPELKKRPTYSNDAKSGYEIHPAEPEVGNNKPHIKWWDWSNGKANGAEGHIFFG